MGAYLTCKVSSYAPFPLSDVRLRHQLVGAHLLDCLVVFDLCCLRQDQGAGELELELARGDCRARNGLTVQRC